MKSKALCLSAFLLLAFLLPAQEKSITEVRKLTVDDAVMLAADNNISVKESRIDLELLERKNHSSWNSVSPSLNLSGSMSGSGMQGNDPMFGDPSFSASASVRLNFAPSLFTSIQSAKLAYEAGEASYESTIRTIELNVRKTFYNLLYLKQSIELQESALQTAKQTYESNKAKYNMGRLSELDLLNSQYNYERNIPNIESSKKDYAARMDSFKQVLGLKLTDVIELTGDLKAASSVNLSEEILETPMEDIPAVKNMMRNIEVTKNNLLATRFAAWGPSVSASGTANLSKKNTNAFTGKETGPLSLSYSLGVNIPLDGYLPWSNGALNVASQKASLEKLELELENLKTSTAISVRNSYNSILQAQRMLGLTEQNVDLMERTYKMTLSSYNAGSTSLAVLQTAADNLASARYNLQVQRFTIISAVLDLENMLGIPYGILGSK